MLTFGLVYEAEMGKLPPEASELTRQLKHQELVGAADNEGPRPEAAPPPGEPVDLRAILGLDGA